LNLPANAPLIVLYRSGIFAFIAFVALAVVGCVYGYRAVRSNSFPRAMYGGIVIGLCVVAMQLDHGLASTPNGALTYSIFLGFMVYVDRARTAALQHEKAPLDSERAGSLMGAVVSPPRVTHSAST
jgi:hypothetical protein